MESLRLRSRAEGTNNNNAFPVVTSVVHVNGLGLPLSVSV